MYGRLVRDWLEDYIERVELRILWLTCWALALGMAGIFLSLPVFWLLERV